MGVNPLFWSVYHCHFDFARTPIVLDPTMRTWRAWIITSELPGNNTRRRAQEEGSVLIDRCWRAKHGASLFWLRAVVSYGFAGTPAKGKRLNSWLAYGLGAGLLSAQPFYKKLLLLWEGLVVGGLGDKSPHWLRNKDVDTRRIHYTITSCVYEGCDGKF